MVAPVSIDGTWSWRADPAVLASAPCGDFFSAGPSHMFSISQSGRSFVLTFSGDPNVTASGRLEGNAIHASFVLPPSSSAAGHCLSAQQVSLLAAVDREGESKSLAGAFSLADCPACGSVKFQAELQPSAPRKAGE